MIVGGYFFFFKQKTAYEMLRSLVGSEMCIRDSGCTTADVVKAIYYLIEQKYETGQALPVTGGQVMLS